MSRSQSILYLAAIAMVPLVGVAVWSTRGSSQLSEENTMVEDAVAEKGPYTNASVAQVQRLRHLRVNEEPPATERAVPASAHAGSPLGEPLVQELMDELQIARTGVIGDWEELRSVPEALAPKHFEQGFQRVLEDCGMGDEDVVYDCSEPPCVALIRNPKVENWGIGAM